ncbi:4a-hydroxytetrahydrobiopterin dehydratase [Candidatus Pacearchaeota archaeon]|nr:4a-hydroxytetrahydrobiopterin dehydratase [Candidatus Pacearchaeota archaeon]
MELLSISQINENLGKLSDWNLEDNGRIIIKNFKFEDFKEAVDFINKVSEIAETEGHHPDIKIYDYNNVEIKLTTHSVLGLTEKDFKVAEKIDSINFSN